MALDILDHLDASRVNGLFVLEVMHEAAKLSQRYVRMYLPERQEPCSFFDAPEEFIRRAQINGNAKSVMHETKLEFASRLNGRLAHLDTDGRREWLRGRDHILKGAPCAVRSN